MANRVVLMGIDGLEWSLVRQGIACGQLPVLAGLLEKGAYAEVGVLDCVPGLTAIEKGMVSPVLWTTVATGQYYFQHGVHDFRKTIACPEQPRLFESGDVQSPRLWDVLTEYGRRSLVIGYYVTHPAYAINGIMIGDMFGDIAAPNVIWPPEAAESLQHLLTDMDLCPPVADPSESAGEERQQEADPAAMLEALAQFTGLSEEERRAIAGRPLQDRDRRLLAYRLVYPWLRDRRFHRLFCSLAASQTWDFATVYYRLVDFASHGFWGGGGSPDGCRPDACAGTLHAVYRWMDQCIGEVLALLDPQDRLLIVSDHGFTARQGQLDRAVAGNPTSAGWGEHKEPAFLVALGGQRTGAVPEVTLLDIAPTILDFFGIPQALTLDGGPVPGLLAPDTPRKLAPVPAYAPACNLVSEGLTPQQEQTILTRLAALGYIEE